MPLTGNKEEDFHDFRHGKTFKKTRKKFGRKKANSQMIAAVLNAGREKKGKRKGKKRK